VFDISLVEMLIVFAVALVVIGPERLPAVARTLGKYVAKARRFVAGVRSDIERELHNDEIRQLISDQKEQIDDLQGVLDDTRKQISEPLKDSAESFKSEVKDVEETLTTETDSVSKPND